MIAIDLPWPSRDLHPNARKHWTAKARATKAARVEAGWAAKAAGVKRIAAGSLAVTAVFSPPDNRRRDTDGMLSSIKAYFDGIADVIGIDDSAWQLSIRRLPMLKGGAVRIEIEVISDMIADEAVKFRNERRVAHIDEVVAAAQQTTRNPT